MNAIAGPSSLSPPAATSSPERKPRGKKGKVFSENLGLGHLLSLAAEAGSTEEDRNQSRVEKNKETSQWKKEKREAKEQRKERAKAKEAATGKVSVVRSSIHSQPTRRLTSFLFRTARRRVTRPHQLLDPKR